MSQKKIDIKGFHSYVECEDTKEQSNKNNNNQKIKIKTKNPWASTTKRCLPEKETKGIDRNR